MKKQSSIEYLEQFFNSHCNPSVCDIEYSDYKIAFEQAKEMESQKDAKYNEMLEMLKYFTDFPDSDFDEFSYSDKFTMTVMAHKIAEAKQLIKETTEI
jgi:hypothetical protein